jgi:hypothetical protein
MEEFYPDMLTVKDPVLRGMETYYSGLAREKAVSRSSQKKYYSTDYNFD